MRCGRSQSSPRENRFESAPAREGTLSIPIQLSNSLTTSALLIMLMLRTIVWGKKNRDVYSGLSFFKFHLEQPSQFPTLSVGRFTFARGEAGLQ